jgi:hypothetical protein
MSSERAPRKGDDVGEKPQLSPKVSPKLFVNLDREWSDSEWRNRETSGCAGIEGFCPTTVPASQPRR